MSDRQQNDYYGNKCYFQRVMVFKQPEVRYTAGGKAIASFTFVESQGKKPDGSYKEGLFMDVQAWDDLAHTAGMLKGKDKIYVSGRLRVSAWTDKNTGQKRTKTYLVADEITILTN